MSKKEEEQTVKQIDLSGLTLHDLLALQNALPEIIEEAKKGEKDILRQRMAAMAAESGFALEELFDEEDFDIDPADEIKKKRKQIGFVKAKYVNPEDSDQTWSGRGRKPKWAAQHVKDGGKLTDLLIHPEQSEKSD